MFDDEPDTEWIIRYTPAVPAERLARVQEILRAHQPFVPGVHLNDPYDVATYVHRQVLHREEICLLVDRNLVTRWVGAVRGSKIAPAHRVAAAVMAFAQCADLLIEPTISFYEVVGRLSSEEINHEIDAFYTAEEIEPSAWANIALNESDRLPQPAPETQRQRVSYDLSLPLSRWRRTYVLVLKIAELQLSGGRPESLMRCLIEWMYADFLLGAAAIQLASYYFAPGAPRSGLLKALYSADREKAIEGIQNAAWDLTLIGEWLHRVQRSFDDPTDRRRWILCSFDHSIARMAEGLLSYDDSEDELPGLIRTFSRVWKPDISRRLASLLYEMQQSASNPSRYLNQDPKGEAVNAFIAEGEQRIRSWTPRIRST